MSEKLNVELSGDARELQKATKNAVKSLNNFEKAADKSIGAIDKPTMAASKSMGKLGKATANANPSLQEFSRVIQDAPYGIQGVGNNITQLVSQFGYLQKSAGGTKAAFKLMLSSLAGPAGILFAVSTAVSLLTVFSSQLNDNRSEAEKNAEATKKASEALQNYADSLEQVARARLKGEQSAQKELMTLGQLRKVAEDTSRSTTDRQKAIQELRRLYPDYFKDLSDEKILTGGLKGVYDELTTSIIARARATAATNQIVKNSEKQLIIESKLAATKAKISELDNKALALEKASIAAITTNARGAESANIKAIIARGKVNDLLKEQNSLLGKQQSLELSNIDLSASVSANGGIDLSDVKLDSGGLGKLDVAVPLKFDVSTEGIQQLGNLSSDIENALSESASNGMAKVVQNIDEGALFVAEALMRFNEGASELIQGTITETFANLGASIGEALTTGGNVLNAVGNTILQGLGGFLSKMGAMLIEYGTLAVLKGKLDLAILAGGPAAIGAGLAAIAVGIALSAAGAALGSAATSGSSGGGSSSTGGSGSRSSFTSSGGGFGDGRVVFEISGQKLIGVLDRTRSRNLAIGG